jgi:thymidine phosphorylase
LPGQGIETARAMLTGGMAWAKFQAICEAQGGMRVPPRAAYTHVLASRHRGRVVSVDNRLLARVAKLAGAPQALAAGVSFHAPVGTIVDVGQPLITIHAETPGELAYARTYAEAQEEMVLLTEI